MIVALVVFGCIVSAIALSVVVEGYLHPHVEVSLGPLEPVVRDPAIRALERRWGFSRIDTPFVVQVTPVGDPFATADTMWSAYELDRRADDPALALGARGVVVLWSDDDVLALDDLNRSMPAELIARGPEEIEWVAFVHRSTVVNMYSYPDGSQARSERVDLRVARRDGTGLVGRMTTEAIPPLEEHGRGGRSYTVRPWTVAQGLVDLLEDERAAVAAAPAQWPTACFVQSLPPLGPTADFDPRCTDGANDACIAACRAGSAGSCLRAAWTLSQGWWHPPDELFRLACVSGSATGCAELGSRWIAHAPEDPLAQSCARALVERACEARDPLGCGLMGEAHARDASFDRAALRTQLEGDCEVLGGFACEAFARAMESGVFGTNDPIALARLRQRACTTGYHASCAADAP